MLPFWGGGGGGGGEYIEVFRIVYPVVTCVTFITHLAGVDNFYLGR